MVPFDEAAPDRGPTCSCNLAPLCRSHHRLKTHTPWRYTVIEPGTYLWSTPHGYRLLVDHTGTRDVTPAHPSAGGCLHLIDSDDNSDPDPPDR